MSANFIPESMMEYIKEHPDQHKEAQKFGEFVMSSKFTDVDNMEIPKVDNSGLEILYKKVMNDIVLYGLTIEDLTEHEIEAIRYKLGEDWKTKLELLINTGYKEESKTD